jgi:F0F1-type ATP synthase delta subunit
MTADSGLAVRVGDRVADYSVAGKSAALEEHWQSALE